MNAAMKASSKESKLLLVRRKIHQAVSFLVPYLPLANAHNSDFIVSQHWKTLIPQKLAEELLSLDDRNLCLLSSNCLVADKLHSEETVHNLQTDLRVDFPSQVCCIPAKIDERENILQVTDHLQVDDLMASSMCVHKTLGEFVEMALTNTLPNLHVLTSIDELRKQLDLKPDNDRVVVSSFMKTKKSYEIDIMSAVCGELANKYGVIDVVDIGTGRGYLGCHLALMHGLRVIGIDSSSSNTSSAVTRTRHLQKQWKGLTKNAHRSKIQESSESSNDEICFGYSGTVGRQVASDDSVQQQTGKMKSTSVCSYKPVTMFVDSRTDLDNLINIHWPITVNNTRPSLMLTGLHTCGNLSADLLRLFALTPSAVAVCQVSCCYNLLTEQFVSSPIASSNDITSAAEPGFPMCELLKGSSFRLGRNARMLAAQSPERTASSLKLPPVSIYWRSLLQVVLRDTLGYVQDDWSVGKISSKCRSFEEYARKALQTLGITNTITDEQLADYTTQYSDQARKNMAFFTLRTVLGPCIEALVLLDRLAFLLEQDDVSDAFIVPMFDAVLSPRRYAIVAAKSVFT